MIQQSFLPPNSCRSYTHIPSHIPSHPPRHSTKRLQLINDHLQAKNQELLLKVQHLQDIGSAHANPQDQHRNGPGTSPGKIKKQNLGAENIIVRRSSEGSSQRRWSSVTKRTFIPEMILRAQFYQMEKSVKWKRRSDNNASILMDIKQLNSCANDQHADVWQGEPSVQMRMKELQIKYLPALQMFRSSRWSLQLRHPESLKKKVNFQIPMAECEHIQDQHFYLQLSSIQQSQVQIQILPADSHIIAVQPQELFMQLVLFLFQRDLLAFRDALQQTAFLDAINNVSFRGDNLLEIVARLVVIDNEYKPFFISVLETEGVQLGRLNCMGWNLFHQIIQRKNIFLTVNLFHSFYFRKRKSLAQRIKELRSIILTVPDCYFQLDWEVNSFLPIIGLFAPNDRLKVWKQGESVRIDFTLVGYKSLSCKRRQMSLLFCNQNQDQLLNVIMVNHQKKIYYFLNEELTQEEIKLIITEMLVGKSFKVDSSFDSFQLEDYNHWFKGRDQFRVNELQARRFKLSTTIIQQSILYNQVLKMQSDLKNLKSLETFQAKEEFKPDKIERNFKQVQLNLWIAHQTKLTTLHFMNILEIFASGNQVIGKVIEFLKNDKLDNFTQLANGLPLKLQIPFSFTLYGMFQMREISFAVKTLKNHFRVPGHYQRENRSTAQKTLESAKKRTIIANYYLN